MDHTALTWRVRVDLLDRAGRPCRVVADDEQRGRQAAVTQVGEEVVPCVERLASAGGQADEGRLAVGGDAQAASTGSAGGPRMHPEEGSIQE
jgi:hypothetical protein